MEKVTVSVELGKEAQQLTQMLAQIAKVVINAGKDGFQVADIVPIIEGVFVALSGDGLKGLGELPAEIKADPAKFALALMVALDDVL